MIAVAEREREGGVYVVNALLDVREAFQKLRAADLVTAETYRREIDALERLGDRFRAGEITTSTVVYQARALAQRLDVAFDELEDPDS